LIASPSFGFTFTASTNLRRARPTAHVHQLFTTVDEVTPRNALLFADERRVPPTGLELTTSHKRTAPKQSTRFTGTI
jgi:hypothetical protein